MISATTIAPSPDWRLAVVLVVLLGVAVAASYAGRLGVARNHLIPYHHITSFTNSDAPLRIRQLIQRS